MNMNQYTQKTIEAIQRAQQIAVEYGHQQVDQEHVMLALRTSQGLEKDFLENNCDAAALTQAFAAGNLVSLPSGNVRIPEDRFFISDSIISDIV